MRPPAELVGDFRSLVAKTTRRTSFGFPYRAAAVPKGVEPMQEKGRTGGDYETDWSRRLPARMARVLIVEGPMRGLVRAVANPERTGFDRLSDLDEDLPVIFAANHHSHVDAPLLITSIPEPWRHKLVVGAAADYFFATRMTGALSALAMGAIPIDRTRVNRKSADLAAELIEDGWSILIFPEGGRSPDGWGQPFRGGAAYLSVRTDAPVVPIHLEGTGRIMSLTVAPLTAAVLGAVEEGHLGIASATNNAIARLGGLLAVAIIPSVAGFELTGGGSSLPGYVMAMRISAVLALSGSLIAFITIESGRRVTPAAQPLNQPCQDPALVEAGRQ